MKTVRVVEYIDLEGENHTDEFEKSADAVRFFMMVTSERLVKRAILSDKVIIPDLDPNHKSQEEYQMIHNALSESEDLPF